MVKSQLIETTANLCPWPFRAMVALSNRGFLPSRMADHWVIVRLSPKLFPDGVKGSINGKPFYVPIMLKDFYRDFEPLTLRIIQEHVREGSVFLDVGANVGYFSVIASSLGATVHAFEPGPSRAILQRNLKLHRSERVTVYPIAIGSKEATVSFYHTPQMVQDGTARRPEFTTIVETSTVQQRRLDDVVPGRVDFIKVDVEGADLDVLLGAEQILCRNPQAKIIAEWHPGSMAAFGHKAEDLPRFFRDRGFTKLTVLHDREEIQRSVHETLDVFAADKGGWKSCNLFAAR